MKTYYIAYCFYQNKKLVKSNINKDVIIKDKSTKLKSLLKYQRQRKRRYKLYKTSNDTNLIVSYVDNEPNYNMIITYLIPH